MALPSLALAQNDKGQNVPGIYLSESGLINAENFPAYSRAKQRVLVVHEDASCCFDSGEFLVSIDVNRLSRQARIRLTDPEDSVILSEYRKNQIVDSVAVVLREAHYVTLSEVNNEFFSIVRTKGRSYRMTVNGPVEQRMSLQLKKLYLPAYCCVEETGRRCEVFAKAFRLWIDTSTSVLLLSYGINGHANGCDSGPFYFVSSLAK